MIEESIARIEALATVQPDDLEGLDYGDASEVWTRCRDAIAGLTDYIAIHALVRTEGLGGQFAETEVPYWGTVVTSCSATLQMPFAVEHSRLTGLEIGQKHLFLRASLATWRTLLILAKASSNPATAISSYRAAAALAGELAELARKYGQSDQTNIR